MLDAKVITCSVRRDAGELYEMLWRPEDFPRWASGLSDSGFQQDGEGWTAQGPGGPIRITFTGHNPFGVMDHAVELEDGSIIRVPMRIIANGEGSEVMLTLFRQPGMDDERFAADEAWVRRDFEALRALGERSGPA